MVDLPGNGKLPSLVGKTSSNSGCIRGCSKTMLPDGAVLSNPQEGSWLTPVDK